MAPNAELPVMSSFSGPVSVTQYLDKRTTSTQPASSAASNSSSIARPISSTETAHTACLNCCEYVPSQRGYRTPQRKYTTASGIAGSVSAMLPHEIPLPTTEGSHGVVNKSARGEPWDKQIEIVRHQSITDKQDLDLERPLSLSIIESYAIKILSLATCRGTLLVSIIMQEAVTDKVVGASVLSIGALSYADSLYTSREDSQMNREYRVKNAYRMAIQYHRDALLKFRERIDAMALPLTRQSMLVILIMTILFATFERLLGESEPLAGLIANTEKLLNNEMGGGMEKDSALKDGNERDDNKVELLCLAMACLKSSPDTKPLGPSQLPSDMNTVLESQVVPPDSPLFIDRQQLCHNSVAVKQGAGAQLHPNYLNNPTNEPYQRRNLDIKCPVDASKPRQTYVKNALAKEKESDVGPRI
ncbi:uncharacterized protein B0I36DRAFT_356212 [Microdochium trichocladiopsis]|uniref:Uncharacterized protein n=1 Tax=Microdochium trichocladiopsis TaxID=1682393 RepID=A0A9P8XQH4_9PEZI|nr:uncharacterized protein B0I36DRAFT_356212 [Microdochium trichocladiopsis]KAH7012114.1 hypothetical protein B0I36DRAFT_356212 [Microdochium trichocladiopsis]